MARDARTSRVDLYAAIRRDAKAELSKRALQRKHGVGYRTVAAALESVWPKQPKPPPKRGSRLDAYRDVIDAWLRWTKASSSEPAYLWSGSRHDRHVTLSASVAAG